MKSPLVAAAALPVLFTPDAADALQTRTRLTFASAFPAGMALIGEAATAAMGGSPFPSVSTTRTAASRASPPAR